MKHPWRSGGRGAERLSPLRQLWVVPDQATRDEIAGSLSMRMPTNHARWLTPEGDHQHELDLYEPPVVVTDWLRALDCRSVIDLSTD